MHFLNPQMLLWLKVVSKPGLAYAGLGVVLLLLVFRFLGVKSVKARGVVTVLVTVLGAVAVMSYLEFGQFRYGRYMNPHDVYHYYMGSKYSREIGYSNLYTSSLVADWQGNRYYDLRRTLRSQKNYRFITPQSVLRDGAKYEGLFSPARWREFKQDLANFQSRMPRHKLTSILRDKGYNATPVWNMVARGLTNTFGTETQASVNALVFLDLALLVAMLAMVWAAFGWEIAMLSGVFFASNFFMSYPHIRGAFLRLDWVALLVMSMCALKLKLYKTAGAMMAYAALARAFPAVFVFGIGSCFLWDIIRKRRLQRKYVEFFGVFAITAVVLAGASVVDDGDLHLWREWHEKITLHDHDLSPMRVGFKYVFLGTTDVEGAWGPFEAAKQGEFVERRFQWWAIQAAVLAVCFFASRKLRDYEALALGYVPAVFLFAPTFYYQVMLIVPFMFFASRPHSAVRLTGAAGMFALSGAAYLLNAKYPLHMHLCYVLSWMLMGLGAWVAAASFLTRREEEDEGVLMGFGAAKMRFGYPAALLCAVPLVWGGFAGYTQLLARPGARVARSTLEGKLKGQDVAQLAFAGDVMMCRDVERAILAQDGDFMLPLSGVMGYLKGADASFFNLETVVSDQGAPTGQYAFRSRPEAAKALGKAGFDVAGMANDHALDFGAEALADTARRVEAAGMKPAGLAEEGRPQRAVVLDAGGVKVGCLAYLDVESDSEQAPGGDASGGLKPAWASRGRCGADIRALKERADIVVVSMHWGTPYNPRPGRREVELGRYLIDAGADIVVGHHPHVQQEPEWYRGGVILYSLGNFVFDQWTRPPTRVSRLYRAYVDKEGVRGLEYLPLDKERGTWALFPTTGRFVEVPSPPLRR